MVVRGHDVGRVRRVNETFLTHRTNFCPNDLCHVWSGVVLQEEHRLSVDHCRTSDRQLIMHALQLFAIDLGGNCTALRQELPMNVAMHVPKKRTSSPSSGA